MQRTRNWLAFHARLVTDGGSCALLMPSVRHLLFMIDSILKYVSLITVAGAAISFAIGFWKYLDQRNVRSAPRDLNSFMI
jgi:hypothetical protein